MLHSTLLTVDNLQSIQDTQHIRGGTGIKIFHIRHLGRLGGEPDPLVRCWLVVGIRYHRVRRDLNGQLSSFKKLGWFDIKSC